MKMDDIISQILFKCNTIAIVGLSKSPSKDSHKVADYLMEQGYNVVPINPFADKILGEKCYRSLLELPEELKKSVEIINIFRPSSDVPPIVEKAVHLNETYESANVIWMQLGIINNKAADLARKSGLTVIMDKCILIEHKRLSGATRF
jgi:predicted CoA-binding protein